jgi:hypothetical protein
MHLPHFIVVTDRGVFRAGWIEHITQSTRPLLPPNQKRLGVRWVEELAFILPRQHLVEQVTDMSGAFAPTDSTGSTLHHRQSSAAEVHWKIEADRCAIENLSHAITSVLFREKPEAWSLAAPVDIHLALKAALPQICTDRLVQLLPKNLANDLTCANAKVTTTATTSFQLLSQITLIFMPRP